MFIFAHISHPMKHRYSIPLVCLMLIAISCTISKKAVVQPNHDHVYYEGRIEHGQADVAELLVHEIAINTMQMKCIE